MATSKKQQAVLILNPSNAEPQPDILQRRVPTYVRRSGITVFISRSEIGHATHGVSKTGSILRKTNVWSKDYATKAEKKRGIDRKPTPKFDPALQSIAAKGFLRPTQPYNPPEDVEGTLNQILKDVVGAVGRNTKITDLNIRHNLFAKCSEIFNHTIPNSMLHQIETIGQVLDFYSTGVDTRTPMDKMRSMSLPDNLHVQFDYHRWDPETDTKFGGVTAFPESSTLVTGLKYKKKYKGSYAKIKHPDM